MQIIPIIMEEEYNASPEKLWNALTDKEEMKKWYFEIEEFEPVKGFEFTFIGGDEVKKWVHLCKIIEVDKYQRLSYSWKYEGVPGETLLSFELFDDNDKTKLRLTHIGLETFPSDIPELSKNNFIEGWNYLLKKSLKEYLEKEKAIS